MSKGGTEGCGAMVLDCVVLCCVAGSVTLSSSCVQQHYEGFTDRQHH